jgi:hypothetical protein
MMNLVEVITDPDMGYTSFLFWRSEEIVNSKGRSEKTGQFYAAVGNIQPAPGKERELLEEGERQKAAILIFTPSALTAGEDKTKADRVYHDNGVYRVSLAEPWQHHAGFTKAIAVYERKLEGIEQ